MITDIVSIHDIIDPKAQGKTFYAEYILDGKTQVLNKVARMLVIVISCIAIPADKNFLFREEPGGIQFQVAVLLYLFGLVILFLEKIKSCTKSQDFYLLAIR